jgi:hypothetical protein
MTTKQPSLDGEEEPKKHHWTHDLTPEQKTAWVEKMTEAKRLKAEQPATEMEVTPVKKKKRRKKKKKTRDEIINEIVGDWQKRDAERTLHSITQDLLAQFQSRERQQSEEEPQPEPPPPSEEEEDPKDQETSPSQPLSPEPEPQPEPEPLIEDVVSPVCEEIPEGPTTTIDQLSPHDRKAEAWFLHQPEEIMFNVRCIECHELMWTWSKREDMCERCGFELRERRQEFYKTQRRDRTIDYDAFGRTSEQAIKVGIDAPEQRKINPNITPQPKHVPLDVFGAGGRRGVIRNPFS